ncbi:uncharacterized SAM-binding protein YcdF (DUF218 family) [Deinobacterium chartae]|uniref:Uncharacterized SAM-binding protein YcdF (DUF218 family) n=1 Tax=Deinobacterium chartae TaxID=521158 RepID=A0A841HYU6_9DEIO|nr:YdcF family protein [Deinobacterium chartae]MBB6097844.1 uncharacterized SAM-binding protein YcdF (DUF218 family) [Deinobacterium chartae]
MRISPASSGRQRLTVTLLAAGTLWPLLLLIVAPTPPWLAPALLALTLLAVLCAPVRTALVGAAVLLAVATLLLTLTPLAAALLRPLIVSAAPVRADAVVVLAAGIHCGSGELGATSLARFVRGLELWRAGYASTLVFSDTTGLASEPGCPSVGRQEERLVRRLYPENPPSILLLPRMRTTRTEAVAAAQLARERGWHRVLLVTSSTHSRRALAVFSSAGLCAVSVPAGEPDFDLRLSTPLDRLAALRTLAREWAGLLSYQLRGWTATPPASCSG